MTSIGVGAWRRKIDAALARSIACLAVIGPRWANADNLPRLHESNDMVRHELTQALAAAQREAMTLVPTLVEGASLPPLASLPAALQPLHEWNARPISEDGWEDDIRRLIGEIAEATRLPVGADLDSLLHDAGSAQRRIAELEQTNQWQAGQIDALRQTVDELRGKLAAADGSERAHLAAAFAALARGDTRAAEAAFEREFAAQQRLADDARRAQAAAARHVANLALLRDQGDAPGALVACRRALDIRAALAARDPDNAGWQRT